jgi:hypothetical protein
MGELTLISLSGTGAVDIRYTPCLTWPRCGYPAQACPLKHPQMENAVLSNQQLQPPPHKLPAIVPQRQMGVPLAAAYSGPQLLPQPLSQPAVLSSLAPAKDALIIPHDQAYASAVRYHRPTVPSSETFRPPPSTPAVRLRRPSGGAPQRMTQGYGALSRSPGLQVCTGRGRRVSIAVQGPDVEFAGGTLRLQAKEFAKGHTRGKVRSCAVGWALAHFQITDMWLFRV